MRLGSRMAVVMLVVAGLPLAAGGYLALRLSEEAQRKRTVELHEALARVMADKLSDEVRGRLHAVELAAAALPFEELSSDERLGAMRLIFRQIAGATAVALVDRDGTEAAPTVHLSAKSTDPTLADRPPLVGQDVSQFGKHIPFDAALKVGAAIGPVYIASDGSPRLALAVRTQAGQVVAVEIAIATLLPDASETGDGNRRAFVVDDRGRVILDQQRSAVALREDRSTWRVVQAGMTPGATFDDPILGRSVGASARDKTLGWAVALVETEDDALGASRKMRDRMLLGLAGTLVGGLLVGGVFARALVRPIRALHKGAVALQGGELGHKFDGAERTDEIGDLARALGEMAAEVQRWRRDLEGRVADKTKELSEMQELLLRAQKLAAVSQLGAGVAHEINNPLTGLLGLTQILRGEAQAGTKARERLEKIEAQALRIREIVENLRRLSDGSDAMALTSVDIHEILDAALALDQPLLNEQRIAVTRAYNPRCPAVAGDPAQLTETFFQLITNARRAMRGGGTLTLTTRAIDGRLVAIDVTDTGEGMTPEVRDRVFDPFFTTKRDWTSKGLGLTQVNRIVDSHGGRVTVKSAPGEGSTFTIILPVAQSKVLA